MHNFYKFFFIALIDRTSAIHKYHQVGKHPDLAMPFVTIFPRSFLAPDRYLARSNSIVTKIFPSELVRHSKWDKLSKSVWDKFSSHQQSQEMYVRKLMLWKYLLIYIKVIFIIFYLFFFLLLKFKKLINNYYRQYIQGTVSFWSDQQ